MPKLNFIFFGITVEPFMFEPWDSPHEPQRAQPWGTDYTHHNQHQHWVIRAFNQGRAPLQHITRLALANWAPHQAT